MTYTDSLEKISDISFDKILKLAKDNVPPDRKDSPWIGLNHGVKLLSNDDEMAQYIAAYGSMHREKLNAALDTVSNPGEYFSNKTTIIDWGCGQGLASICFYDYMHNLGIEPTVSKIILIEPSAPAINRAYEHLRKYTSSANIILVNKFIDDVEPSDINTDDNSLVLHFFSNILDISSIHLDSLAELIRNGINAEQLFFCVGPLNSGASRIAEFAKQFEIEDLIGEQKGYLSQHGTISMMVFRLKANIPEIIKVEYYRRRRTDLGNNTALNRILADTSPVNTHPNKALQFYSTVIALERMKSPGISDVFFYPYTLDTGNGIKFNIDIQENREFEQVFLQNADKTKTKWPKNLNIGLSIMWDNTVYRLMEYIYPFEDLKTIDITRQFISVNLSMFTISADIADKLELTNDIVEVISDTLTDRDTTLGDLEAILRDAIGHTVTLYPQLSLALTAEAPVLAQISSELKNLTKRDDNHLMQSFLSGSIKDNTADKVSEDDIISVVNMDDSQRHAIATALNSKVSVITGPPGTGKTQMIVNLLANAMLKGKRVLVASKNNKAVDNIKYRFDQVNDCQYLLRFGSRDMIKSKLIPSLVSMMDNIPYMRYDAASLAKTISNYNQRCTAAADARKYLGELVRLTDCEPEQERYLQDLTAGRIRIEEDFKKAMDSLHAAYSPFDRISYLSEYDWNRKYTDIKKNINILQSKNSGLCKLFFNIFSKGKYAALLLNDLLSLPSEIKECIEKNSGIRQVADVRNCDGLLNLCQVELEIVGRIKQYLAHMHAEKAKYDTSIRNNEIKSAAAKQKLDETRNRIRILSDAQEQLLNTIKHAKDYISSISNDLLSGCIKSHLAKSDSRHIIARYKNYLPDNIPWKSQNIPSFAADARRFVDIFRLNSVTNLSIKNAYPMESELFDILIIDEASQCDVASALPLLYRARQLVVIGDPLQLKHITSVTESEEHIIKEHLSLSENPLVRYVDYSLWDYCNDLITGADTHNTRVTLDCHYRCHPQIIGYSNEMFYQRKLGTTLKIRTKEISSELPEKGIVWTDVIGTQMSDTRNINEAEAKKAISIATDIARMYPDLSIGIISPFKHQAENISSRIPTMYTDRIVSDTVHKFQGDERDVIIYSLVVTDNSPETKIRWIDHNVPNLVNVAVTRARTTLYVVGNRRYIREHSNHNLPLGYLVEYTENKVSVTNVRKETVIIDTNVFINFPDILSSIDSSKQIIISAKVIDELDKLKVTLDDGKRRNAELALRNINRLFNIRNIRMECADLECLPVDLSRKNPDNMILSVALKYRNQNPILLTSDNGLQLKAKGLEINTTSPIALLKVL